MYYSTARQMEKLDILAVRNGLQIRQMMELAGWHMVEVFKKLNIHKSKKIVIVVGRGNKGGDGLSAARHLVNHGWQIKVVLVSKVISDDARHHLALLKKMKTSIYLYNNKKGNIINEITKADYLIDSLIGYQLKGSPRGGFKELIELMNAVPGKIITYDLPSGLEPTTGRCLEPCVRAWATLTLALPKKAFQTKSGKEMSGQLFLGDIGIPSYLYNKIQNGSRPDFNKQGIIKL